jgi:hypothetical protein
MAKKESAGNKFHIATIVLTFIFAVIIAAFDLGTIGSDQWQMLAQSFLAGKLFFLQTPSLLNDSVLWSGHYYWPFPPFPAVLFMPFVAIADIFNMQVSQGGVQFLIVIAVFILVYRLARKFFQPDDAAWFAIAFTFASSFLWIAPVPAYTHLSYVVAVATVFGALLEYVGQKRWWLIGLLMSVALASRTAAGLGIFFFLGDIFIITKGSFRKKLRDASKLMVPFIVTVLILGFYNFARFGSFFETGYSLQILMADAYTKARSYGVFSPIHIPGNLYYFLFNAPVPILKDGVSRVLVFPYIKADPWGMGIVFVSPYLLYLFLLSYKDKVSRLLIVTSAIIAVPIFLYHGIGFTQLGYRYGLDFMPFIYFLFMRNYAAQYGPLPRRLKWLIALSALFDLYLFFTLVFFPSLP